MLKKKVMLFVLQLTSEVLVFATECKNNVDPACDFRRGRNPNDDQLVSCTYNFRVSPSACQHNNLNPTQDTDKKVN